MNVVITGANRGLGLGFTRHYLERGDTVWAGYRADRGGLASLDNANLHCIHWDVGDIPEPATLERLPGHVDLLINNAGIYGPGKHDGQSLRGVLPQDMLEVFDVDCVGALRVVQATVDRLVAARGIIANVSSKMGSTADNSSGGCYAYRAAKAALVIVSRSMGVDLAPQGVRVVTLHPGWVKTDMTGHSGEIDVSTSVAGMCHVIDNVDRYAPGTFVAWDGEIVPY
jgi:NAD(P)-dependent dehydrogenase (short-subunit alcohol dehydrogenase family)